MRKSIALASFVALAFLAGCASSNKTDSSGNMGVVGESKKGSCCSQKSEGGSMGVMSDSKDGHCADKGSCSTGSTCPMTGKTDKKQN